MFFEGGLPQELLMDNDPAFCSREFRAFAREWSVNLRFRCAYAPAENSIAVLTLHGETNYGQDALSHPGSYLLAQCYTQRQSPQTVPANRIHRYELRVKMVDAPTTSPDPRYGFY